jgi:AraC family transcriptional regulator of arabinose operon
MDKTDISSTTSILDSLRTANLQLSLHGRPFVQSQDHSWSLKDIVYNDYDLFYCFGGSAEFTIDHRTYELKSGMALLCAPGEPIWAVKTSQVNFEAIAQHFNVQVMGGGDLFSFVKLKKLVPIQNSSQMYQDYLRFSELHGIPRSTVLRQSLFLSVLFTYIQEAYISDIAKEDPTINCVFELASKIEGSITRSDALEHAASLIPLSRDYLVRLFKKHFQIPPKEYLQQCRMNAARNILSSGASVKETAYRCGFQDELYFSRFFHQREGISPKQYQLLHKTPN